MKAVHVLGRRDRGQHAAGVQPGGQRQLRHDTVDAWIGIQFRNAFQQRAFRNGFRKCMHFGMHPGVLAGAHLVAHVDMGRGIGAGQDRGEPGADAARGQRGDPASKRGANGFGNGLSIDDLGGHGIL